MSEYTKVQTVSEVEPLFEKSKETPVMFFKHSLTCPISSAAFREYEKFLEERPEEGEEVVYTLVEIQNARDVSNAITERGGVKHESPQALLVKDGKVSWHASHWSIKSSALASAVD